MNPNRYRHRDANEPELIGTAETLGAVVIQAPPLDLWVYAKGLWVPTEVKNPKGRNRLQPSQIEFRALCERIGAPHWLWRTSDDVLANLTRANDASN